MKNLTLLLVALVLGSCSSSGKKSTEKLYYRLPTAIPVSIDKNIIVKRPTAMGILGNRPMVVQTAEGALKQMNNNFWLDSPKVLLQNYLVNLFSSKIQEESFVLNSQILRLEKKQNIATLKINFVLTNPEGREISNKTFEQNRVQENNSVALFVEAIGEILKEISMKMVEDIR